LDTGRLGLGATQGLHNLRTNQADKQAQDG